jgi:hypothetical protein
MWLKGRVLLGWSPGSNVCHIGAFNWSAQKRLLAFLRQVVGVPVRVMTGNATRCLMADRHISHQLYRC